MLQLQKKKLLLQQVSLEPKIGIKKLVSVLAISISMTVIREEVVKTTETTKTIGGSKNSENGEYLQTNFARVPYIWYLITFWKESVLALFDSGSKINAIYQIFVKELELFIRQIDVRA